MEVIKKEMIAMLLAGGRGSRLGILTSKMAKPAVPFGGKYRIIDFPLSNCINSGVDTVGVLTQYMPLKLNTHIGIGIPWDLDKLTGGVSVLPPYEKIAGTEWYTGTANAIYQNMSYMENYHPDYVLILSGDHIYKMDYESMLDFHKENHADVTIAVMPVPMEEAKRFGIMITDEKKQITDFEEKPEHPRSNLASMGIYIFSWKAFKEALEVNKDTPGLDFGKHIIPYCHDQGERLFAYEFNGYWKDVGTLTSYWEANMQLIDIVPEFNLYEEYWKIYTNVESLPPQYYGPDSLVTRSIIGDGSEIYGTVEQSVIGSDVVIGKGAQIRDSIIIDAGCRLDKAIVAERAHISENVVIGEGEEIPNETDPGIYRDGLTVVAEDAEIPSGVSIGKNAMVNGKTRAEDWPNSEQGGGRSMRAIGIILAGGRSNRMRELSRKRAVCAMPVAGSFRSIDFALTNMEYSRVQKVAVLTQFNSRSLNEHLSSSKWWDFGRKQGGMFLFTPSFTGEDGNWYRGTADAIAQNISFLKNSHEPYVVIASGDCVYKMDYNEVLEYHVNKRADITVVCKEMPADFNVERYGTVALDADGRITEFVEKPIVAESNIISCGIYVIRRRALIELLERSKEEGRYDIVQDILIRYKDVKRIYGYKMDTYWSNIASVDDYFRMNMDFLKPEVRDYFFRKYPGIHSKVADLPPAKFNVGGSVHNSLLSSGCIVNGAIENSVLFQKVYVGNNCVIRNSLILDDVHIGDNAYIENCIVESDSTIPANAYYKGEDGVRIVIEDKGERYKM